MPMEDSFGMWFWAWEDQCLRPSHMRVVQQDSDMGAMFAFG